MKILRGRYVIAALALGALAYFWHAGRPIAYMEEVQLSSGTVIEVARRIKAQSFGEIGGPGGWEALDNSLELVGPAAADKPPLWHSATGLMPMIFDRDPHTDRWFIVATFYTCEAWRRLGRPKLPYAEFYLQQGQWKQVDFQPKWIGRKGNVLLRVSNKYEPPRHTLASKHERMSQSGIGKHYKEIVAGWHTNC
jgi:hypothetical protein